MQLWNLYPIDKHVSQYILKTDNYKEMKNQVNLLHCREHLVDHIFI